MWRSVAIGVSRLTGMNSDAMSVATHNVSAQTALHDAVLAGADRVPTGSDVPDTSPDISSSHASCDRRMHRQMAGALTLAKVRLLKHSIYGTMMHMS